MPHAIETKFVTANQLEFEVHTCGQGDKFALLLHGFPEHAYSWRHQLPLLAELGYTAWAPNLRGYGQSSRPKGVKNYAIPRLLEDIAGLIDAAGAESTLLIGHDWGGALAWSFALKPLRPLNGLVVMNLPHPMLFYRNLFRWPQIGRSWYIFFFQLPWLPEKLLTAKNARAVTGAFYGMAVDKSRFPREELAVFKDNALQAGAMTAMLNYYRAFLRWRPSAEYQKAMRRPLETPTLLLWGEEDEALGKELTYGTEHFVRDLTLRYLPDVSHWVQQEAPETVNAMLAAWLKGQPVPYAGPGGQIIS
jgi:pimeloyl-ACP methyl ester carboxylesterase